MLMLMLMDASSFTLTFLLLTLILLFLTHEAEARETPPPTPNAIAPPPPDSNNSSSPPFRPGIAVVVCVLTTIISLTSLLLLYIKHCNGGITDGGGNSAPWTVVPFAGRKNSGIDRSTVESLPVFRFGALRGQKEGLDCAVCLNKFEAAEVLRLLPKCKHAFHVECVDTWLDAHSTCPLCRYRVDPEDILLVDDARPYRQTQQEQQQERVRLNLEAEKQGEIVEESRRRHSSVGVGERESREEEQQSRRWRTSFRRSLDSISGTSRKKKESVGAGSFVGPRKDGMLLTQETERECVERRLEHRIIVSPGPCGLQQRWSDVEASDLLYLTSEMIMSRGILNSRSVSEITGLSRFVRRDWEQEQQGLVKRWLGWISKSRTQPALR